MRVAATISTVEFSKLNIGECFELRSSAGENIVYLKIDMIYTTLTSPINAIRLTTGFPVNVDPLELVTPRPDLIITVAKP